MDFFQRTILICMILAPILVILIALILQGYLYIPKDLKYLNITIRF